MNKYLVSTITIVTMSIPLAQPVFAQTPTLTNRQEVRQEIKTLKESLRGKDIRIAKATVTSIGSSSMTVTSNNKTYTVNSTSATNLRRHYFGKATLAEFSTNDLVDIVGTYPDDSGTVITARLIRDVSIMKRHGVFFGTVTAKTDTTITLVSEERGTQNVTISPTTKYINQKGVATTAIGISSGDTIRVFGLWDKTNNTITEVTVIKDFTTK